MTQLSEAVQGAFAQLAHYVSLIVGNNPLGSWTQLMSRPDVDASMAQALAHAQQAALDALDAAWGGTPPTIMFTWLREDIEGGYQVTALRQAIRVAYDSVPPAQFHPGVTPPGQHPSQRAAEERAAAVSAAILAFGQERALRNGLTVSTAESASAAWTVLLEGRQRELAGETVSKRWRTSRQPPDARTCHWCRHLNGVTVPLAASFAPHDAGPADLAGHGNLTQPPPLYHGRLPGPPRHPRCRCYLEIVVAGEAGEAATVIPDGGGQEAPPQFLSSAAIRAMPEDRYQSLLAFLRAATHELGQLLRRLARHGRRVHR